MEQDKLILDIYGKKIEVVVGRATARMGIRRSLLIYDAMDAKEKADKEGTKMDQEAYVVSYRTLPDLIAGTMSVTGMDFPMTADQLLDMPEDVVNAWLKAIYAKNPHWDPANLVRREDEKKADSSSD
jgi:hypothetical protein